MILKLYELPEDNAYPPEKILKLLEMAEAQGHPVDKGSYIDQLSLKQIDALVHGRYDA